MYPKNWHNDLASRWNSLRLLWSRFFPFSTLFWLFFRLRWEVLDSCFIHGYESTQKLGFIVATHRQTLEWNIITLSLFRCEEQRYSSWAQPFHVQIFSQYAMRAFFEMPTISASSGTFSWRSSNTILWFFFTNSGVVTHLIDHCDDCLYRSYDLV